MPLPTHNDILRFMSVRGVNSPEKGAQSRRFVVDSFSTEDPGYRGLKRAVEESGQTWGVSLHEKIASIQTEETRQEQMQKMIEDFNKNSLLKLSVESLARDYPKKLYEAYLWHRDNNSKRDVTKAAFKTAVEDALGSSVSSYIQDPGYYQKKLSLWETLIAEYFMPSRSNGKFISDLVDMIRWFWIIEKLNTDGELKQGQEIYEAMNATVVFPGYIRTVRQEPKKEDEPRTRGKDKPAKPEFSEKDIDIAIEEIQHAYKNQVADRKYGDKGKNSANDTTLTDHYFSGFSASTLKLLKKLNLISERGISIDHALEKLQNERELLYSKTKYGGGHYIKSNGKSFEFDDLCYNYTPPDPCAPYNEENAQIPARVGLIRPPGMADLKVIRSVLLKYEIGEMAHIENVLDGETKVREFNTMKRMEETLMTEEETTTDNEKESQTTDRFELEKEVSSVVREDMQINTGVKLTATYGPVSIDTHFDFQYNTSKEDSNKVATKNSQETVNRALSKVIERKKTQRTVTSILQIDDKNKHKLKNESGNNIHGLYYWVDKYYLSKVINYGKRLMFEFVIPEPAAFYLYSKTKKADGARLPPKPPSDYGVNSLNDINDTNYFILSAIYGVQDIVPPPPISMIIAVTLKQDKTPAGKDQEDEDKKDTEFTVSDTNERLKVPDGYLADRADISFVIDKTTKDEVVGRECDDGLLGSGFFKNCEDKTAPVQSFHILIGNRHLRPAAPGASPMQNIILNTEDSLIPVSIKGMSRHFIANIEVTCKRTDRHYREWKNKTFTSIVAAYNTLQQQFEDWERSNEINEGILIEGNNPGINREIEKEELKKHCIEMMTGQRFESFDAMRNNVPPFGYPEFSILESFIEGNYIQFFEQAFEWEQITYLFYPYFWGKKPFWLKTKAVTDPDPVFNSFLQAGAARVLVPARPGFEYDVVTFFASGGQKIWGGKQAPIPGDEHWLPIIDEIKEQEGQFKGGAQEGDPWIYKVPTTLVYLDNINAALVDNSAKYPNDVAAATAALEFS